MICYWRLSRHILIGECCQLGRHIYTRCRGHNHVEWSQEGYTTEFTMRVLEGNNKIVIQVVRNETSTCSMANTNFGIWYQPFFQRNKLLRHDSNKLLEMGIWQLANLLNLRSFFHYLLIIGLLSTIDCISMYLSSL